ncbi:hypothetical protein V6N13_082479 [Hibiscus sabdariffa]
MVDNNGAWKWGELEHLLPVTVLHRLLATMSPQHEWLLMFPMAFEKLLLNSRDFIESLLSHRCVNSGLGVLFCTALELLDRDWNVRIFHISRTANRVADGLAKMSRVENACPLGEMSSNSHVFSQPPSEVLALFHDDLLFLSDVA